MGRKIKDRTGDVFGKWTVTEFSHTDKHTSGNRTFWMCRCICGTAKVVCVSNLLAGKSTSCGCARGTSTHAMSSTITYKSWQAMKDRCLCTGAFSYSRYGGRGITVCDRWKDSFENFYKDMGDRPSDKHSIDREDNDAGYSPTNCRWATSAEQANNKSTNRQLTYNGITMNLGQWAKKLNIDRTTLRDRLKRNPHDECFYPKIP